MSRIVYVNGEYLPEEDAKISIFDRGFLMADGVYEVTSVLDGKLIDFDGHAVRLERSLRELEMENPISKEDLLQVHRELVSRNGVEEGMIYLQITRGAPEDRDFVFPDPETTPPTVVLFTQNKPGLANNPAAEKGIKVISIEDLRWGRRDIKTVQLLYPSMGKMMAKKAGADDAWMVQDGHVTEGTSNNAYIIKGTRLSPAGCQMTSCTGLPELRCCAAPKRPRWRSSSARLVLLKRKKPTRRLSPRQALLSCPL